MVFTTKIIPALLAALGDRGLGAVPGPEEDGMEVDEERLAAALGKLGKCLAIMKSMEENGEEEALDDDPEVDVEEHQQHAKQGLS